MKTMTNLKKVLQAEKESRALNAEIAAKLSREIIDNCELRLIAAGHKKPNVADYSERSKYFEDLMAWETKKGRLIGEIMNKRETNNANS